MNLVKMLLIIANLNNFAFAKTEAECKSAVEKEMYLRGLVNSNVCLNTNNYPDIHINTDLKNLMSGKADGKIAEEDLNAMSGLELLLNDAFKDVAGAKKEVAGYTDGEIAVFNRFDSKFFKPVKGKTPEEYQSGLADGTKYKLELDRTLVQSYIDSNVKDPTTKNKLNELLSNTTNLNVDMKKTKAGTETQYIPEGSNELLIDILRNHELAIDRTNQFCDKMPDPVSCKKDQVGNTSIDLLGKSKSQTEPQLKNYSGKCAGRRGVAYRFIFPDSMVKSIENENGELNPSFNIPGREIQNNMQLSAGLDFMKKINLDKENFKEIDSKSLKELEKSKYFNDYSADNQRFADWLKKNGSGCADSKYQVDNQRRLYWATQKEIVDAKTLLKNSNSPHKAEYEQMLGQLQTGDFSDLKKNAEFNDIYELATFPEKHGINYFDAVQLKIKEKYHFSNADGVRLLKLEEEYKINLSDYQMNMNGKTKEQMKPEVQARYEAVVADMNKQKAEIERLKSKRDNKKLYEEKTLYTNEGGQSVVKDSLKLQMIALMRTLIIGRPVMHEPLVEDKKRGMSEFYTYDGTYPSGGQEKYYNRYSSNGESTKTEDIGYAQADVHSCHDVSDALVEHMKENPDALKKNLGRTGEESADLNVLDEVSFGIDAIKPIQIKESKAGVLYNQFKIENFQTLEQQGYLQKGSVKGGSISTLGWVCQECGSGIHVHTDGSVHPVSRQRVNGNYSVSENANQSFDVTKGDGFSLGGMQHLKVYELQKCKDCSCISQFKNGTDFKNYLSTSGKIHNMVTYNEQNKPMIDPEKNKFDVKDPNICLYVAPVPHSCNFDPIGESDEKSKNKEIRESLYCKLENFIKTDTNFNSKHPQISSKKDSNDYKLGLEPSQTMNLCNKSKFPQSEEDCFSETKEISADVKDSIKTKSN